jgi:hypothetical protein
LVWKIFLLESLSVNIWKMLRKIFIIDFILFFLDDKDAIENIRCTLFAPKKVQFVHLMCCFLGIITDTEGWGHGGINSIFFSHKVLIFDEGLKIHKIFRYVGQYNIDGCFMIKV